MLNTIAGIITGIISLTVSFFTGTPTIPNDTSSAAQTSTMSSSTLLNETETPPGVNSDISVGLLQSVSKNSIILLLQNGDSKTIFLNSETDQPEDIKRPDTSLSISSLKIGKVLAVQYNDSSGSPIAEKILQLGDGNKPFSPSGSSIGTNMNSASSLDQASSTKVVGTEASQTSTSSRVMHIQEN